MTDLTASETRSPKPAECPMCRKWFVANPARHNSSCTVDHGGMCCHWSETEVPAALSSTEPEMPEWNEESGEMEPTLPEPIASAFAHFRAMSEPYFNKAFLDDAEQQLRLAILKHANSRLVNAVRAWRREWDDAPAGTNWREAANLPSWQRLMDEIGYDRESGSRASLNETPELDGWLVWSADHDAWWGPNRGGYFTSVLAAGVYSEEEAKRIESTCNRDGRGEKAMTMVAAFTEEYEKLSLRAGETVAKRLGLLPGMLAALRSGSVSGTTAGVKGDEKYPENIQRLDTTTEDVREAIYQAIHRAARVKMECPAHISTVSNELTSFLDKLDDDVAIFLERRAPRGNHESR